jgi:hypothetical protein
MDPSQIRTQSWAWFLAKSFVAYLAFWSLCFALIDWLLGGHRSVVYSASQGLFFALFWTLIFGLIHGGSARHLGVSGVLRISQVGRISVRTTVRQALEICRTALVNIGAYDLQVEDAPPLITARTPSSWSIVSGGPRGETMLVTLRDAPGGGVTVEVASRPRSPWPLTLADIGCKNLENVEAVLREVAELAGKNPAADSAGSADGATATREDS